MAKIEQLQLTVEDNSIHCDGCESRIEQVLGRLPGVMRVKADHRTQKVDLALDEDRTSLEEVRRRLDLAGYHAQ